MLMLPIYIKKRLKTSAKINLLFFFNLYHYHLFKLLLYKRIQKVKKIQLVLNHIMKSISMSFLKTRLKQMVKNGSL